MNNALLNEKKNRLIIEKTFRPRRGRDVVGSSPERLTDYYYIFKYMFFFIYM